MQKGAHSVSAPLVMQIAFEDANVVKAIRKLNYRNLLLNTNEYNTAYYSLV